MNLQLVKGNFSQTEALDILNELVHVKIRFHENKINRSHNEEDIKMREKRIKQLQNDLHEARQSIFSKGESCCLEAEIKIA